MDRKMGALDLSLISMFAALTVVGSYIHIPLMPVPITLQTLFTYLSGALLGKRLGTLSQLVYVLLGVIGLPVYAGGKAGVAHLLGPTGGFLAGFVVGAYVIGFIIEQRDSPRFLDFLLAIITGTLVIYAMGIMVLYFHINGPLGLLFPIIIPFFPGDCLKILLSSYIATRSRNTIKLLLPARKHVSAADANFWTD